MKQFLQIQSEPGCRASSSMFVTERKIQLLTLGSEDVMTNIAKIQKKD